MDLHDQPQRPEGSPHLSTAPAKQRSVSLKTFLTVLIVVALVMFIIGTRSSGLIATINRALGTTINTGQTLNVDRAQSVYQTLLGNFDGPLDETKLQDGAARGLAAAAGDPYTVYFDAEEAADYQRDLQGTLSGIGAEIGVRDDRPTILRVIDDAPAQKAGLKPQDIIVAVDDTPTISADAAETARLIRGESGTKVKLAIVRDKKPLEFEITRATVTDPSVAGRLDGDVGIITIRRFDMNTGEQARVEVRKLTALGVKSFVVDLRDNGGGFLNQAQSVAGMWLNDRAVVSERRGDVQTDELYSTGEVMFDDVRTVLLINGGSASASEIVAGALKDYSAAQLIGETTFGKGTVQQLFDLEDGSQLKVTVAHWFTPEGQNIGKTGVEPDQTVELNIDDANAGRDPQLEAALKVLE